ncbi:Abi family protein [Salinicoccus bachuensis]|uniref:Abi family protein n=1 Tax=Salinicoccus bachuensis TaxID=3136731 RepID=A0ABZ3CJB4_9STAP
MVNEIKGMNFYSFLNNDALERRWGIEELLNQLYSIEDRFYSKKPFITKAHQIKLLKKRNLKFEQEDVAEVVLHNIPYYKLVNGFKNNILKDSKEDYSGYSFEDLIDLYNFDRELSTVIFKYILIFEESFISSLSHYICIHLSYKDQVYLDRSKYNRGKLLPSGATEKDIVFQNIERLKKERIKPIEHYKNYYDNVPPWILFQSMDFGNKKYLYKICSEKIKDDIVSHYLGGYKQHQKDIFMYSLNMMNNYRNGAAHGDIISNTFYIKQPKISKESYVRGLASKRYVFKNYNEDIGKVGLFSLMLCMNRVFRKRTTVKDDFRNDISKTINDFETNNPKLYGEFCKSMTFPRDYLTYFDDLNNNVN